MTQEKIRFSIPTRHKWLKGLRGGSLVLEYLLDKEFGTEIGADGKTADLIAAEKIVQAQRIIEKMREEKSKEKNKHDESNSNRASPTEKKEPDPG